MKKLLIFLTQICIIILVSSVNTVAAPATPSVSASPPSPDDGFAKIDFYDRHMTGGLVHIGNNKVHSNTNYWHYTGGYWLDAEKKEAPLQDSQEKFWEQPQLYRERPGMRILARGELPADVKEYIKIPGNKEKLRISVFPDKPDSISVEEMIPMYKITDDEILIYAMPHFVIDREKQYGDYVGINIPVPIVKEGYGFNVYSMYGMASDGKPLGSCASSLVSDSTKIEFTDIVNASGLLKPGKKLEASVVNAQGLTTITELDSGKVRIGHATFSSGGAVGLMFVYTFGVYFYKPPESPDTPILPDLSVTGIRESSYVAQSIAISNVGVRNDGNTPLSEVCVRFFDGETIEERTVSLMPNEEKEVEFIWLAPETPGAVGVYAHVNPDAAYEETDYSNNRMEHSVLIVLPPSDLSVTDVTPTSYPAGLRVNTVVTVRNSGTRNYPGSNTVEVRFSVPNISYTESVFVNIEPDKELKVSFSWSAPPESRETYPSDVMGPIRRDIQFYIIAEVNPTRSISETDYSNNRILQNASATYVIEASPDCNQPRREWQTRRFVGYDSRDVVVRGGRIIRRRYPVYETLYYYAEVSLSANVSPTEIKSGYGIECEVTAGLSTNYVPASSVTGLQDFYAFLPTDGYRESVKLEKVSDGGTVKWVFPKNPQSVKGARCVYVPTEWRDGQPFVIRFTGYYAYSPGGAMCANGSASAAVEGNMYEDDYTAMY